MEKNQTFGDCPECAAKSVVLIGLPGESKLCAMCDARAKQDARVGNSLESPAIGQLKNGEPLLPITEDYDTSSLMDKNDQLIYNSNIAYYGTRYQTLTPGERESILEENERMIGLLIRESQRHTQVLKIREQAIRAQRRENQKNLNLSLQAEIRKKDKRTETAINDWNALSKDSAISKADKKLSNKVKKLNPKIQQKLKNLILTGAFDEEKVAEHAARKAERLAEEIEAARSASEKKKSDGDEKETVN